MSGRRHGFTIVELLIAALMLGIVMAIVAAYFAQQTRVSALSKATNEAELTARTVAEAVAQEFQMAGARATFVAGNVVYANIAAGGCDELIRSACVVARSVSAAGVVSDPATAADINGYSIFYRTSLVPASPCRRVDVALVGTTLHRSDVACGTALASIDLAATAFADNVDSFTVRFQCASGVNGSNPNVCYAAADDYVRQAEISVGVTVTNRVAVESDMQFTAYTPNLRPSVNYGRTE